MTYQPTPYPGQGGSMVSLHMVGRGYIPPGHGYKAPKDHPDKPIGPSFIVTMNRMWRGPGGKYCRYAFMCFAAAIAMIVGGTVYFCLRNNGRMTVMNTEVLGAFMITLAIFFTGAFFQLIYKSHAESNNWRSDVRFRAEGLYTAAAYNLAYLPDDGVKLETGTFGPMAIKELPRSARGPPRSRGGRASAPRSGAQTPASMLQSGAQTPAGDYRRAQGHAYEGREAADPYQRSHYDEPEKNPEYFKSAGAEGGAYDVMEGGKVSASRGGRGARRAEEREAEARRRALEREVDAKRKLTEEYLLEEVQYKTEDAYRVALSEEPYSTSDFTIPQTSAHRSTFDQQTPTTFDAPPRALPAVYRPPTAGGTALPPVHRQPVAGVKKPAGGVPQQ